MNLSQIEQLIYLVSRLRDPDDGCPWDIKQDFSSIAPCVLEEACEVIDAIERGTKKQLINELGDLLFQVIFISQLGKEENSFDFNDVVTTNIAKFIRRHPHVFPDGKLESRRGNQQIDEHQIKKNWENIKQQERHAKSERQILADIPPSLTALSRAAKLQKRAAGVGFDWQKNEQVLDKMEEELAELRTAIKSGETEDIADEMGDILFTQVNLARHLQLEPEQTLRQANYKFEQRFNFLETLVRKSGKNWQEFSLGELEDFWNQAKAATAK